MRLFALVAAVVMVFAFSGSAVAADAAGTYKAKCAMCHGKAGEGTKMAPALKGSAFVGGDAAAVKDVITNGRAGGDKKFKEFSMSMPKVALEGADLDAMVDYIKGL